MSPSPVLNLVSERKHSVQMRAVLFILNADPHLMNSVWPFLNLETETIFWDEIFKIPFGSGNRAGASWAYCIWTDELRPRANCFDAALSMTPNLQAAVLQALALRWGLVRN